MLCKCTTNGSSAAAKIRLSTRAMSPSKYGASENLRVPSWYVIAWPRAGVKLRATPRYFYLIPTAHELVMWLCFMFSGFAAHVWSHAYVACTVHAHGLS